MLTCLMRWEGGLVCGGRVVGGGHGAYWVGNAVLLADSVRLLPVPLCLGKVTLLLILERLEFTTGGLVVLHAGGVGHDGGLVELGDSSLA
jgi:hypothetical protein